MLLCICDTIKYVLHSDSALIKVLQKDNIMAEQNEKTGCVMSEQKDVMASLHVTLAQINALTNIMYVGFPKPTEEEIFESVCTLFTLSERLSSQCRLMVEGPKIWAPDHDAGIEEKIKLTLEECQQTNDLDEIVRRQRVFTRLNIFVDAQTPFYELPPLAQKILLDYTEVNFNDTGMIKYVAVWKNEDDMANDYFGKEENKLV